MFIALQAHDLIPIPVVFNPPVGLKSGHIALQAHSIVILPSRGGAAPH